MAETVDNSKVLNYFESAMRNFIIEKFSHVKNWWDTCIPPEIREDAVQKYERAKKINDVLNKPDYQITDYLNFDDYERIISRKDNWRNHFEKIFRDKTIFTYKMHVILSLRNDIMHGRELDEINSIRIRLHCYDILSQIYETKPDKYDRDAMIKKLGLRSN